jgi:hypothetical protein
MLLITVFVLARFVFSANAAEVFDQSHGKFARVLSATVRDGRVDYAKLKAAPAELDAYLKDVGAVTAGDFAKWNKGDRLALLLNLYNAQTLRLIVDHYPLKSIRSIGALPGAAWRGLIVQFGGQMMSLEHLENKIIRPDYKEPRIHFALVCAAVSCPPLRSEPYVGPRLGEQLDDQARKFLGTAESNRFDAAKNTLHLSQIFEWYKADFTGSAGSVANYVKPFLPKAQRDALADPAKAKVQFIEYDWALNDRK